MFTLKRIKRKTLFYFQSILNLFRRGDVFIITESESWIIKTVSNQISKNLNRTGLTKAHVSFSPLFLKNKIIHFASLHVFTSFKHHVHPSNKIIVSWYHLNERDIEKTHAQEIAAKNITIHTSCFITKDQLVALGIKPEQIKVIPLGINLKIFHPLNNQEEKIQLKKRLGLPLDKFIIGSFQKDGNGWEQGLEPKLVKGPDIFCSVVEKLSKEFPVHILLSGPARGYVKRRLSESDIPFTHLYQPNPNDIANLYHALDLYIISARAEGGPMSLLESWATGTPLVATTVGLVKDLTTDNETALLSDIEDIATLTNQSARLLQDKELAARLAKNGLVAVQNYTWETMSKNCFSKLYAPKNKKP